MQSQQKRVKWSRGETAEALEERTDTGVTQASVELMENCIPDIYGNISRRPGLSVIPLDSNYEDGNESPYLGFIYDEGLQFIPFYITENDIILIGIHTSYNPEYLRIKNGKVVSRVVDTSSGRCINGIHENGVWKPRPISYAQQNNYLIVATATNIWKIQFPTINDITFTAARDVFKYSAGWYAPEGTKTKQVTNTDLPGLNVSGNFGNYTYTNGVGDTNVYSWTDTGLDGQSNLDAILAAIPLGSIIEFPENGAFLRVEGYVLDNNNVMIYGELLTPVANTSAYDTRLKVEYGYTDLIPSFSAEYSWPHPRKVLFLDQRLWAGGWSYSVDQEYALTIGSQIAKYNDFENNYNQENEAITLDILTSFKERIFHLVDYNGLKIMTDAYEYAYENGAVVKQSANGCLEECDPLVFDSLCLYVDSTGQQIKAMQYEFQSNIFNSTTINQISPHDLVWYPISMASYEDKIHSTGKYLFVVNKASDNHPRISVCNFVPSNQANIWGRWSIPNIPLNSMSGGGTAPLVFKVVQTKKEPIFMLTFFGIANGSSSWYSIIYPAVLDFNANVDITCEPTSNTAAVIKYTRSSGFALTEYLITPSTEVAVYSNGEFKWLDTLTASGALTKDISGLTNVTVGLPINATIRSHPIDVGGKTKSVMKRIGKAQMSVHDTPAGAITINGKTGYMNPRIDHICFYGVTGMKDEIKYTITNNNGAMFHLESLLMNIEYGTLDS